MILELPWPLYLQYELQILNDCSENSSYTYMTYLGLSQS